MDNEAVAWVFRKKKRKWPKQKRGIRATICETAGTVGREKKSVERSRD